MIRLFARLVVSLIADAVALIAASALLTDMTLDVSGFVIALAVFAGTSLLIEPLIRQVALKNTPALLGSSALIATLVSLIVATVVSSGMTITGAKTWVLATVAVWVIALVVRLLLPFLIFKEALGRARERNA